MIGIYKIVTKHNNKMYIGSSDNIEVRYRTHLSRLKRDVHHSIFLQNVYNKYGVTNLEFSIIEVLPNSDNKLEREQYWLDYYKTYNRKFGYNMSKSVRNNTYNEKIIYQYDIEGFFIKEWESIKKAEDFLKLTSIVQALKLKCAKTCGGYQWRYFKTKKIEGLLKFYCCYNNEGDIIKYFSNSKKFKNFLGIKNFNNVGRAISKNNPMKGYYIKIYDTKEYPSKIIIPIKIKGKKIVQKTVDGEVIKVFNSVTEASNYLKVDIGNLSRCISSNNSKYRTCKGFIWEYYKATYTVMYKKKSDKLLENPEEDNQQPIISLND